MAYQAILHKFIQERKIFLENNFAKAAIKVNWPLVYVASSFKKA